MSDRPLLVLTTGLPGTGKSTLAKEAARILGGPVLAHDWAMSGLRPFPGIQHVLNSEIAFGHRVVGWSILSALARSQLRSNTCVVLDGVARSDEIRRFRHLAREEGVHSFVVLATCSDAGIHRSRIEGRTRNIPDWYELDWEGVERSRADWEDPDDVDLTLSAAEPLDDNLVLLARLLKGSAGPAQAGETGVPPAAADR
jgi:predicted kinase